METILLAMMTILTTSRFLKAEIMSYHEVRAERELWRAEEMPERGKNQVKSTQGLTNG